MICWSNCKPSTILRENNLSGCNTLSDLVARYKEAPKAIVLYGIGGFSPLVIRTFLRKGLEITCLCDSNPQMEGVIKHGYPVISPAELMKSYQDAYLFIATGPVLVSRIYDLLINMGFEAGQIFARGYAPIDEEQYFSLEAMKPVPDEIYVDAGCLDGATILQFARHYNPRYKKIYGMEPDPSSYSQTLQCIKEHQLSNVAVVQEGAWSGKDVLSFSNLGNGASSINETGSIQVSVTSIDDLVGEDAVTFIKMDIEGAELEALKGAQRTIMRNKPKLAICIYHKPEDVLTIPFYIHSLASEYKFYIRHHSASLFETVLYATTQ